MPTGALTRVLGTSTFLSSTIYYDEEGNAIQSLNQNIKSGFDVATMQYHFDGRVLSSSNNHTASGGGYSNYDILTKYLFDKLGRVKETQKRFGSNAFKTITTVDYDDMGRIKAKHLDPSYTAGGNSGLENLTYNYNIHNKLIGINKDYALKSAGAYNKWEHFFGLYLGFDNRDNVFNAANLTGQMAGQLWNTQGDDNQRRYNYTYDNANRLVKADFTEKAHVGDNWNVNKLDYSVKGTSGKITYDLNGNILNMLHRGVVPGNATPITIDELSYSYELYSNKLSSVTDQMVNTSINGAFGDFKDGTNGSSPDYVYDNNGNLVIDLNKNAKDIGGGSGSNGIHYNYLDKPDKIRLVGKGVIDIVYSADGEKLKRSFTPEGAGTTTTTIYINQFIYQEVSSSSMSLQAINFEEGRIRIISPTNQSNGLDAITVDGNMDLLNEKRSTYDYFITDHLGNVRMIVGEEVHAVENTATMETARGTVEESIFGQVGSANEVLSTRYTKPTAWTGNTSGYVSRLGTNAGHNIGPNTLQKVMAGDKITAKANYYYNSPAGGNNTGIVNAVLNGLLQSIGGSNASSAIKGNASTITGNLGNVGGFATAVQPNGTTPVTGQIPAYLTILFFDERFNFIEAADGGVAQQQVANNVSTNGANLELNAVKAPKNGYVYVYVSNQREGDVYFDDFNVKINAGNIVEENHYYSYGLRIATISSKKVADSYQGEVTNNYLYQGAFSELDDDIGWTDFMLRNYDAQIGRWVQQDPYQQFYTPYSGMGGDPVNNIDPSGGSVSGVPLSTSVETMITLQGVFVSAVRHSSTVSSAAKNIAVISKISTYVGLASKISTLVNSTFSTLSKGVTELDEWKQFYKSDLIKYVKSLGGEESESNLGKVFEDIFEESATKDLFSKEALKRTNFRRSDKVWTDAGLRNSKPDFVADDFYDVSFWIWDREWKRVIEGSAYEVKQNNGKGIYLSSNDNQIMGHITNLSVKHAADMATGNYNPSLALITTYDVDFSYKTLFFATFLKVQYTHSRSKYKIVDGKYYFKFVNYSESDW